MARVELIYDSDCPNLPAARRALTEAFNTAGLTPRWDEWDRGDPASPAYVRSYGSPTILVNGRDIVPQSTVEGAGACRVYSDAAGQLTRAPAPESILAALGLPASPHASSAAVRPAFGRVFAFAPVIGSGLALKLACAACWPAFAALLGSAGVGFLVAPGQLVPFMLVFLAITLAMLAYRARSRRGLAPFALGVGGAVIMMGGGFGIGSDVALFAGVALLVSASIWNAWPRKVLGTG